MGIFLDPAQGPLTSDFWQQYRTWRMSAALEQVSNGTLFWDPLPGACLRNFEIGRPERGPQMEPLLTQLWSQKVLQNWS